ncbi:unnamed protein product [Cyclocybe aegerita]|uniref:Major facilitator superfamily (MFS) profile domain-containing protein n=1 Tax=Cyclocybe aegerita TaxID=1973307 RepID=A0A8S0VTZ6_CYCAE|nr:unnamed protein product [Cyclocybe aegerita]
MPAVSPSHTFTGFSRAALSWLYMTRTNGSEVVISRSPDPSISSEATQSKVDLRVLGGVVGAFSGLLLLGGLLFYCRRLRNQARPLGEKGAETSFKSGDGLPTTGSALSEDEVAPEARSPRLSLLASNLDNASMSQSRNLRPQTRKIPTTDNVWHLIASCTGVFAVGLNDSATGANIPSIQKHYGLSYEVVSLIFLAGVSGYLVSCMLNPVLQHRIGTCWILLIAGVCYGGGSLLIAFAPPFPLVIVGLTLAGLGGGFCDASLTSVVAHFDSNRFMNMLYVFFGVGALSSPFVIGGFLKANIPWNRYYWLQFAFEVVMIAFHFIIFRNYEIPCEEEHKRTTARAKFRQISKKRILWVGVVLIILGFAIVDTLSNWLTSYLIEVKGSEPDVSRYQLSMLWAGMTTGRLVFSLPYIHIPERIGNAILLALLCGAIGVLWVANTAASNWVLIFLAGFFIGPNTPAILSIVSSRVPPSLKSTAVSIIIGSGLGIGATLGPLLFGVAAERVSPGLRVLPPVMLVLALLSALTFWAIPPQKILSNN